MPRLPKNYLKSIIYKICCKDPLVTETYTGSTTDFVTRKSRHKSNCSNVNCKEYHFYVYKFIRDHGGWDNWEMVQLEQYPCNTQHDLALRERHWFEVNVSTLNKCVPSRTYAESHLAWRRNNVEYIKQKNLAFRNNNKEHIKQYKSNYYQNVTKPKLLAAAIPDGYATA